MEILNRIGKWFRIHYNNIVNSIAFIPAIVAIAFLVLSFFMLILDRSELGKEIKSGITWLSLKDASTARSITGTISTGMISLLVFSFSTVLIVLNQAASKMSNRVLSSLIGNRFQQIVLGFYVGTIVYSLFLLSTIRDIDSGIYVPALSIYLLMGFTILDIFLFIYFLHFATQSVKYETIIRRLRSDTMKSMETHYGNSTPESLTPLNEFVFINADESGYLQGGDKAELIEFCSEKNCFIELLVPKGGFIVKGNPLLKLKADHTLTNDECEELLFFFDFYTQHPISDNPVNGFHRLAEVAISAYSGLSDPVTAEMCIQTLTDLFEYRLHHKPESVFRDEEGVPRITIPVITFGRLLHDCFLPIYDRSKNDRLIMKAMHDALTQLLYRAALSEDKEAVEMLLNRVNKAIDLIKEKDMIEMK